MHVSLRTSLLDRCTSGVWFDLVVVDCFDVFVAGSDAIATAAALCSASLAVAPGWPMYDGGQILSNTTLESPTTNCEVSTRLVLHMPTSKLVGTTVDGRYKRVLERVRRVLRRFVEELHAHIVDCGLLAPTYVAQWFSAESSHSTLSGDS